ncbi:hydroxymethylglutaryl-CoA reductase, degradative [Ornithobacterium rhinotracheale]|uniref:hydroxymethylglutaryl-CoA reductase, degradative n=1 Tax=Ornithobacterium rhinotracheale TaxID=28251 RepID=UPI00129CD709|nr:hydroxymethylglutaryl-CoA reductase, degradative [Ornithobacterium rhinotracheale]MRI63759.1 hydroxymethylglutaryl-CoA reductase, degradative [Ornithobacterium rhinotracheale]
MIKGFSKLNKDEKIKWLTETYFANPSEAQKVLAQYQNDDAALQKLHDEFSENTLTNYYLPFGVAPNFIIDGEEYTIPMAVEESSVVAAASKAAKFWSERGGFKTQILGVKKLGHVHFMFEGNFAQLQALFNESLEKQLREDTASITKNMEKRGGGILSLELIDKTADLPNYYQLKASFNTKDSMGANFINSCLEQFAQTLEQSVQNSDKFSDQEKDSLQIVMSILSNYTPECMVRAEVECPVEQMGEKDIDATEFVEKFSRAVRIAEIEPYRATTHNKGIMNGVDAVVIATGNDFRAVEACFHAYASHNGKYSSLSHCEVKDGKFRFWIDLPIALGTVGGLTSLHPLVKWALELLKKPTAEQLMRIVACAGLAQNFAALRSLVTTGIQKGHMKMHLQNILNQLGATPEERATITEHFKDQTLSHSAVVDLFHKIRN